MPPPSQPLRDPGPVNLGPSTRTPGPTTSWPASPPLPRPASPTAAVDQYVSVLSRALDAEVREINTLTRSDEDFYADDNGLLDEDDDGSLDEDDDGLLDKDDDGLLFRTTSARLTRTKTARSPRRKTKQ